MSESALRLIPPSVPPLPEPSSLERAKLRRKRHLADGVPVWIYPGDLEFGGGAEIALQGFAAWNRSDAVLLMACRRKTPQADEALTRLRGQAWQWGIEPQVRWVGETRHIHELLGLSNFVVMVNRTAYAKMDYPLVALESMCLDARIGSVCDLPFEDGEFDLTCSFKVLAHVPDIETALREAARVTRPGGHLLLEFYNPWSLRYLAKKVAGPQPISDDRTEADVFTRWDSPRAIPKLLPPNVELVDYYGVRVLTPFAAVLRKS